MIAFNVWAESLDKYIYLKFSLLFVIGVIIFIIFYDFIKLITLYYKKNSNYEKDILEKKQKIIKDIESLLGNSGKSFMKNFLFFLEKNVNIGKYNIEKLLKHIDWNKKELYEMIYSEDKDSTEKNIEKERKIRKLLLDYKDWLEK